MTTLLSTSLKKPRGRPRKTEKVKAPEPEQKVAFKPNEGPQTEFLAASEFQVLYGGAAGGKPKSWFSASFPE